MLVENPSNSLEWMIFLAQKYASMFIKGTWLTLEIAVIGTLVGFVLGYIVGLVNDAKISSTLTNYSDFQMCIRDSRIIIFSIV